MPQGHLRRLTAFEPSRQDHVPAFRIALSVAVPLFLLLALGRSDLSIYAAFGAFTSLYARQEPLLDRFRRQCIAGAMILSCILLGMLMSRFGVHGWGLIAVCSLVAALGAIGSAALALRPAGSVFMVFAAGAIGSIAAPAPFGQAVGTALLGVVWSVAMGLFGTLLGEGMRGHVVAHAKGPGISAATLRYGALYLVATLVAGLAGQALGISRPYWAMVAAAAAISAPNDLARLYRAVHRTVGTFGGVLVTAFLLSQGLQTWHVVVWIVVFQFLAEAFIGRNYGFAMLFVTPMALLMMQLAHRSSPGEILASRFLETAIGAAVAFLLVLLTRTREERAADTQAMPVLRTARSRRRNQPQNHQQGRN